MLEPELQRIADLLRPPAPPAPDEPPSRVVGWYTPPALPPADMPVAPEKWRALDRKTRRALVRHHRKVTDHG